MPSPVWGKRGATEFPPRRAAGGPRRSAPRTSPEVGEGDAPTLRDLTGHLGGGSALDRARERLAARVTLKLVDPPHVARAIETAARGHAEERLRARARPAPDVRIADQVDRGLQDLALPGRVLRKFERGCQGLDTARVPVAEAQHRRGGERRFGAGGSIVGQELERVVSGLVVLAQAEQPGDDLAAESGGRPQPPAHSAPGMPR
jgi:hypothetical protein